jgi:hypothetical protein
MRRAPEGEMHMGFVLLAILVAPLPLMLAIAARDLVTTHRPIRV